MRIKLTLRPQEKRATIPINYQYPLSAAIYKILSGGSAEYADWLHEHGYLSQDGKPRKLFVFSKILIPGKNRKTNENKLSIFNFSRCTLFISSPMLEDFIRHFVIGLFQSQKIEIKSRSLGARFMIESVETEIKPDFETTQKCKCLSPIVVSGKHFYDGRDQEYFLRPGDAELSQAIRKNLINKYQLIHQKPPTNDSLEFSLDPDYVKRRGGTDKLSKLITIKEHQGDEATQIKAFESLFFLSGSPELMQTAWECGIGQRNSLGFGMIDVI